MVKQRQLLCMFSDIVELELQAAPKKVQKVLGELLDDSKIFVELNENAEHLARQYIAEDVVGKTSLNDCRHIAIATVYNADFLISWNFKHIVNVFRIRGYNAVNLRNGYRQLEIRSSKDFINYG